MIIIVALFHCIRVRYGVESEYIFQGVFLPWKRRLASAVGKLISPEGSILLAALTRWVM